MVVAGHNALVAACNCPPQPRQHILIAQVRRAPGHWCQCSQCVHHRRFDLLAVVTVLCEEAVDVSLDAPAFDVGEQRRVFQRQLAEGQRHLVIVGDLQRLAEIVAMNLAIEIDAVDNYFSVLLVGSSEPFAKLALLLGCKAHALPERLILGFVAEEQLQMSQQLQRIGVALLNATRCTLVRKVQRGAEATQATSRDDGQDADTGVMTRINAQVCRVKVHDENRVTTCLDQRLDRRVVDVPVRQPPIKSAIGVANPADPHIVKDQGQRRSAQQHVGGNIGTVHIDIIDPVLLHVMQRDRERQREDL